MQNVGRLSPSLISNTNGITQLSFYANGGYYNRGLERPVEREDITGGSKYNTTYAGYNWGAGAKYKLSKRNVIQFDYSGNNYASRYTYLIENSGYLPGQYAPVSYTHLIPSSSPSWATKP